MLWCARARPLAFTLRVVAVTIATLPTLIETANVYVCVCAFVLCRFSYFTQCMRASVHFNAEIAVERLAERHTRA